MGMVDMIGMADHVEGRIAYLKAELKITETQTPQAAAAARSIIRAKPAVVNGEPRSLTKIKGDAGLSR
jgi:hypothetical protein